MARFNALRDALEEDPFLGGGPTGIEGDVEPSLVDHGDTTMARASGLRSRPPIAADWREKEAERLAREKLDAERLVPSTDMLSRVAERNRDPSMQLIPTASAPPTRDAIAPVVSTQPPVTSTSPAGKPESMGAPGLPAPSSEGAGGDADEERNLYLARLIARNAASFGAMGAGKSIDTGAVEALGERLKQVQALRAKREERAMELAREDEQSAALVSQYKSLAAQGLVPELPALDRLPPKQAAGLIKTYGSLPGLVQRTEKTKAEIPLVQERVQEVKAKTDLTREKIPEVKLEGESKRLARQQAAALGWARLNQAAKQAASKLTEGRPDAFRKEVNDKTQALGTAVSKEYGEIGAALQEADRALLSVKGVSPDLFAKVAQATRLDTLNTPEERALFRSIGELRRAAQKAQSGLAVTEPERQEFLQTFGQNWTQSPSTLLEAIEWMRRKTRDKLNTSFATYRAQGDVGNTAIQAYEQAGGVTPNAEYLKPFSERAPRTAGAAAPTPAAQVGGMVKVRHKATGKTATVDRAKADEMLKRPDFEEVK